MRRTSSLLVLTVFFTETLGRVATRHNSSGVAPEIPHPYWWEGPSTESLKDHAYGSASSVPLPTSPPWREEPCDSRNNTNTPTLLPMTSLFTSTGYAAPSPESSNGYAIPTSFTSSASHHTPTGSLQSPIIPTFVYSPLPSASLPVGNASSSSTPSSRPPLVPIISTSALVVYPPYPTSLIVLYPIPETLTGLGSSTMLPGTGSLGTSTQVIPLPVSTSNASASRSQTASTSVNVSLVASSTVSPTVPAQQSSVSSMIPVPVSSIVATPSTRTLILTLPIPLSSIMAAPSLGSLSAPSSSATSAAGTSAVSTSSTTPSSATPLPLSSTTPVLSTISPPPAIPSPSTSSVIVSSVSQPFSIQTTLSTLSTSALASSSTSPFPVAPPYSYNPSASRASISASPSVSEASIVTGAGSSANTSRLPTSSRSSAGTQSTDIPLAPSAAGASGGMTRGKERVWWLSFLIPLLFTV